MKGTFKICKQKKSKRVYKRKKEKKKAGFVCSYFLGIYTHTSTHATNFVYTQKYTHKIDAPKSRIYDKNREKNSEKCSKIINQCKFFFVYFQKKILHNTLHKKPENRVYTYTRV